MIREPLLGKCHHQNAVGCSNAHAHDGAHQSGNAQSCVRNKKKDHDASQSRWKRRDDNERIQPRLKVHHDQQIHQHNGKTESTE